MGKDWEGKNLKYDNMKYLGLVSIVVPTYNCEKYLEQMVKAIISQTYPFWELIVVDDGSTDSTSSMMNSYSDDCRIKYFFRPNTIEKGAQGCRNYGKSIASGKYICFFDADDLVSKTCLQERVSLIDEKHVDYAIFPADTFKDDIKKSQVSKMGRPSGEDILTSFLSHYAQFTVWTAIYNRESIRDIDWDMKIKVYQDLDFSMSCVFHGLTYVFSSQKDANYFYRFEYSDTCISSNHCSPDKFNSTMYLFKKVLEQIERFEKSASYKKDFLQFHLFYFSRIIKTGTTNQQKIFLRYIKKEYGVYPLIVFFFSKPFCSVINNKRMIRLVTMLFYYFLLRPTKVGAILKILMGRVSKYE